MKTRIWWFVLRDGDLCEVQMLNQHGQAVAFAQFAPGTLPVVVDGQTVPEIVVRHAENCGGRSGQYVDSAGRLLDWMGQPLG